MILRSLKKAAPLLVNVAFLISFFWLLFAIIGVQSFKSSLRRNCVWINPDNSSDRYINDFTFCGGYIAQNGSPMPWLLPDEKTNGTIGHKGHLCPQGSICLEGDNPYDGTVSFDNLLQSLELVFVIMTSNTFSDLMYYLMDSDYLAAALCKRRHRDLARYVTNTGSLCCWNCHSEPLARQLGMWPASPAREYILTNSSSLPSLRLHFKSSGTRVRTVLSLQRSREFRILDEPTLESSLTIISNQDTSEDRETKESETSKSRTSSLKGLYDRTQSIWIAVILYSIICQCLRSADMGKTRERFIGEHFTLVQWTSNTDVRKDVSETCITFILLAEVIIRFAADWRNFFWSKRNVVDLSLAVITAIIQLPPIRTSGQAYAWLTIFQILRVYRVVLAWSITRDLIVRCYTTGCSWDTC